MLGETATRLVRCNDVGGLSRPRSSNNTPERRGNRPTAVLFNCTLRDHLLVPPCSLHSTAIRLVSNKPTVAVIEHSTFGYEHSALYFEAKSIPYVENNFCKYRSLLFLIDS